MKQSIFLASLFIVYLFSACGNGDFYEKTINLEDDFEPQLAVTAQLTSIDSIHTVFLSKTIPSTDFPSYDTLKTALVEVETEGNSYRFEYNPATGYYEHPANIPFIANNLYRLTINSADFGTSSSEQLFLASPISVLVDTVGSIRNNDGTLNLFDNTLSLSFEDPSNVKNYYLLEVVGTGVGFDTYKREDGPITTKLRPFSDNELFEYNSSKRLFFTDQFLDGKTIDFNFNYSVLLGWDSLASIEVRLTSTTREAYLYQLTTDKYDVGRIRRFTEPVISYSNIENGIGVFSISDVKTTFFK
jgi:hypothetical protein